MRKKRSVETKDEWQERQKRDARRQSEAATVSDDALDALVKRSIDEHGP